MWNIIRSLINPMPKTKKQSKNIDRGGAKKSAAKKTDGLAEPIFKPEPAYININEHQAEIAAKSRTLWVIVAVFSVVLIIFWLVILKLNIQKETDKMGFSQIAGQISESLARFDTEIKNRSVAQPISAEDLAAIKTDLEEKIKSNPDSSLWPTHELATVKLSIQYPDTWHSEMRGTNLILTDLASSTMSGDNFGNIAIDLVSNPKKISLSSWIEKNKIDDAGHIIEKLIPYSSSTFEIISYGTKSDPDHASEKIIFVGSASTKNIWEFRTYAIGDIQYYDPLILEIIRTIKLIK